MASRVGAEGPGTDARLVAKNTLFLSLADVGGKLSTFVFLLVAARRLGAEDFGVFSFALAFVGMFAVLTDLGLGQLAVREIARNRGVARRLVGNALAIKLVVGVAVIALMALAVNVLGYPARTVHVVYICGLTIADSAFTLYFRLVYQGFERTSFAAFGRALQMVLMVGGVVLLARGQLGVESYAWVFAAVSLSVAVFSWSMCSLFLVRPALSLRLVEWRRMLRAALPFGLAGLLVMLYYWNGSAVLSKLSGDEAVGIYGAAFRLVLGMSLVASAFAGAMYPVMSRLYVQDPVRLRQVFTRSMRYMLLIAVPLGVLGTVLARPVILMLYGRGYEASIPVLIILGWWLALVHLNCLTGHYFLSINRPRTLTLQAGISLGVNVGLNVLLIPRLGPAGAAWAVLAAEAIGFAFLAWQQAATPGRLQGGVVARTSLKSAIAASAAIPPAWLVGRWNAVGGVAVALGTYSGLLVLLGGLSGEDLATLRQMLRRGYG